MRTDILPLFRRALGDSWRSLLAWTAGIAAAIALYIPLFPSLAGDDMQALLDSLPPELVNSLGYNELSSGAGYVQATILGLIGFLLLTIAATSWGTSAIAGDEETGTLELTLAHGVSRHQVVLERAAAIIMRLVWLGLVACGLIIALDDVAELDLEPANVLAGGAALVGLTLLSATLALALGAITGRRVFATAAGAGIAVLGYALNAIANQSKDTAWLHGASPYHWAYGSTPLADGVDWASLGLLFGISAALIGVAVLALSKRDIAG